MSDEPDHAPARGALAATVPPPRALLAPHEPLKLPCRAGQPLLKRRFVPCAANNASPRLAAAGSSSGCSSHNRKALNAAFLVK